MQTGKTQFRRRQVRRLNWIYPVCLQKFLWKMQQNKDIHLQPLKLRLELIQMIRMDKPTGQKRVNKPTQTLFSPGSLLATI